MSVEIERELFRGGGVISGSGTQSSMVVPREMIQTGESFYEHFSQMDFGVRNTGFSSALFAQSAPPPAGTPDWPVATAPARFQMDSDQPDRTSLLGYPGIYLPDPKWANLPLRVFTDTGVAVGSDVLSAAPG